MKEIKDYTLEEFKAVLKKNGYPAFCAVQVFDWVYKKQREDFDVMSNLSKQARTFLKQHFRFSRLSVAKKEKSCEGTEKFLLGLSDRHAVEAVLIPEKARNTLCLSTQVGCRFKCGFCVSGQGPFVRDLSPSEIINQYCIINEYISPRKITNIVFMGIGEPFDNFKNVVKSIRILTDPKAAGIGKKRITISTCGITPKIKALKDEKLGVQLSISLHSADSEIRSKIMPVNKIHPLKGLLAAAKEFARITRDAVTFEYILIKGVNDTERDARMLAKVLWGVKYKLNLIPYNSSEYFSWQVPDKHDIHIFTQTLKKKGIFFTLRKPRGTDINAACGQLRVAIR